MDVSEVDTTQSGGAIARHREPKVKKTRKGRFEHTLLQSADPGSSLVSVADPDAEDNCSVGPVLHGWSPQYATLSNLL